jgi:hypothetical protein
METKGPVVVVEEVVARVAEANMTHGALSAAEWREFESTLEVMLKVTGLLGTSKQDYQNAPMRQHMMHLLTFGIRWVVEHDSKPVNATAAVLRKQTAVYVQQRALEKMYLEEEPT